MRGKDPFRNFRFRVEIDGLTQAAFAEAAVAEIASYVIDYRDGTDPGHVRKLSGLTKYGVVTLKWGVTDSTELADWYQEIVNGGIENARKQVTINVLGEDGSDKARFIVVDAWPSKYQISGLNAKGNDAAIDTLELTNEGVERVQ